MGDRDRWAVEVPWVAHGVVAGRVCVMFYPVHVNTRSCAQESQVILITYKKQLLKISY